jgi:transcriptional regulator with XRE-family HTH domain
MKDKRPAGVIGKEREIVHDNLIMLQTKLGYSNSEMAELLGVEKKYYERIKKNGGPLDYGRLCSLHYNCGVDLNYFVANNTDHDLLIDDKQKKPADDYHEMLEKLIAILRGMSDQQERVEELFYTYKRFGDYLKTVVKDDIPDPSSKSN